jgi:hypothetical protein
MVGYLVYVGGFLAMAVALLVTVHPTVTAEDQLYTAELPAAPVEPEQPVAALPHERAA